MLLPFTLFATDEVRTWFGYARLQAYAPQAEDQWPKLANTSDNPPLVALVVHPPSLTNLRYSFDAAGCDGGDVSGEADRPALQDATNSLAILHVL